MCSIATERMNCFYHKSVPAVGICRACGRGLCPDCIGDASRSLACKERCEEDVSHMQGAFSHAERVGRIALIMLPALGLILIAWDYFGNGSFSFSSATGVVFIIWGLFGFKRRSQRARDGVTARPEYAAQLIDRGNAK